MQETKPLWLDFLECLVAREMAGFYKATGNKRLEKEARAKAKRVRTIPPTKEPK